MVTLLALLAALAAQDPQYDTFMLDTGGGRVDKILAEDLNGDGSPDLIVQSGRDLHVFLLEKGRGFTPQPQQTIRLDPTVFLWCLGKVDGQKLPALFTSGSRAVQVHPFDGKAFGNPRDAIVHPSIFEGAAAEGHPPIHLDFAPDLDRDGRSEVLVFQKDEIFIMHALPGGEFRCLQKLPIPVDELTVIPWTPHMKLSESSTVPLLALGDMTGNGRTDLSYYHDEGIGVFAQDEKGRFAPLQTRDLSVERKKRRPNRLIQFDFPPRVGDFNGDGLLDVAVIYPAKGRVQVYYGRKGRVDFTQPDQVMQAADGWSSGIYVEPLGGGASSDLIMGVIRKFGLTGGIQAFLSGKVNLELHVYSMLPEGRFSKDPVQELKFEIPYTFHVTRDSQNLDLVFRPNFKGDFNKDGLRDMLITADERTLRIYPGVKGKLISAEPSGSISMNPPPGTTLTEPFVFDFNADGVSDLVLKHVIGPDKAALEVKISR
jgi:hypothetical protein